VLSQTSVEPKHALARIQVAGEDERDDVTASPATTRPRGATAPSTQALDLELLARMLRGDRGALAELYGLHAHSLLSLAYGVLRDRQEAEDLLHDVFLEAWRCAGDYDAARSSVRSWLLLRTRCRALDRLRANARKRALAEDVAELDRTPRAAPHADLHRLPAALAQVPEPQQGVIMLAYFEGLSTHEISSRLGIPEGTVKSRTHAAIKTLRSVLGIADD
jgi:RNA polymerase sigma-70 factor (ECF subfamily)